MNKLNDTLLDASTRLLLIEGSDEFTRSNGIFRLFSKLDPIEVGESIELTGALIAKPVSAKNAYTVDAVIDGVPADVECSKDGSLILRKSFTSSGTKTVTLTSYQIDKFSLDKFKSAILELENGISTLHAILASIKDPIQRQQIELEIQKREKQRAILVQKVNHLKVKVGDEVSVSIQVR